MFYTFQFGGTGYQGDLQEKPLSLLQTRPVYGVGAMYEFNDRMLLHLGFLNGRIKGDDRFNPANRARNLSFQSEIQELSAQFEYNLFSLYEYDVTPYVFVGLAYFKFNPYIQEPNGSRIYLADFDTEGQGFFQDRTKYKLFQLSLPYGAGLQWAISRRVRFAASLGIRATQTDYLDDVSTTYVDKDLLIRKKGGNAPVIAYRGDQLPNGAPYPTAGTPRGDPTNKDVYYFVSASLRVRMNVKGRTFSLDSNVPKSRYSCPVL